MSRSNLLCARFHSFAFFAYFYVLYVRYLHYMQITVKFLFEAHLKLLKVHLIYNWSIVKLSRVCVSV